MTNWTKQAEEMSEGWLQAQRQMWESWLNLTQDSTNGQPAAVWHKTLTAWEESVHQVLNAQVGWTKAWAESFETTVSTPQEAAEWIRQAQAITRQWNEEQLKLWTNWFALMRQLDPGNVQLEADPTITSQTMFREWQKSVQKVINAQAEWAERWSEQQHAASNGKHVAR